jgi:hypothetical protein
MRKSSEYTNLIYRSLFQDLKVSKFSYLNRHSRASATNNKVVRYKTRLVLRSYEQVAGRDYNEIYTVVVRSEISLLLLSLAAKQTANIDRILEETGMQNYKPVNISINPKLQLQRITKNSEIINKKIYARRIDQLLYLAVQSRPNIAQAITRLEQFNIKPNKTC